MLMYCRWELTKKFEKWAKEAGIEAGQPLTSEVLSSGKAEAARSGLYSDILEWREKQAEFMPLVDASFMSSPDDDKLAPETAILALPSECDSSLHDQLELKELVTFELEIWQGVASDAIFSIKEQIKYKMSFRAAKATHNRGTQAHTRANSKLKTVEDNIQLTVDRYNFVRDCMIQAGLPSDSLRFQHIGANDKWMYDPNRSRTNYTHPEPWYWSAGVPENCSQEDWSIDRKYEYLIRMHVYLSLSTVECVRWHRQRASRDRHTEEVEILKEELRRVMRTHKKFAVLWGSRVMKDAVSRLDQGRNAYALRTAAMHESLRERAENVLRSALATDSESEAAEEKK